jgi:hypothetical protein
MLLVLLAAAALGAWMFEPRLRAILGAGPAALGAGSACGSDGRLAGHPGEAFCQAQRLPRVALPLT